MLLLYEIHEQEELAKNTYSLRGLMPIARAREEVQKAPEVAVPEKAKKASKGAAKKKGASKKKK